MDRQAMAKALMKDPEWEYGSILPIATRGPRKDEGETYGDISLALPDMVRDPLASWTKIRNSNFSNYDMQDVLNILPIPGTVGAAAVPRGALGMMGTKLYHGTTPEAAEAIAKNGFDRDAPAYFTPNKSKASTYGPVVLSADVDPAKLRIDLDLPGGRLLTVEEANGYLDNEGWTMDDYVRAGHSVGVEKGTPVSPTETPEGIAAIIKALTSEAAN